MQELHGVGTKYTPLMETYALLDSEWPVSTTAKSGKLRLKSLKESNDDYPMHMIMLRAGLKIQN